MEIKTGHRLLKDIIKRTLAERGEMTMHKYALYKLHAIDWLRDFYLDTAQSVKTKELELDHLHRAELPEDYIDYVKIGVRVGDHVKAYLRDDNIATFFDESTCGKDQPNASTSDEDRFDPQTSWYFHNYLNSHGEHAGGLYGYGNGRISNGFTFTKNSVQLASSVTGSGSIYLEYISSEMIYSDDAMVPIIAEQACKDYIKWRIIEDSDKAPMNQKVRLQQLYDNSMRIVRARKNKMGIEDIVNSMRSGFMMAPKT